MVKFVEKNPTDLVLAKAMSNRSGSNFKLMVDKGDCACWVCGYFQVSPYSYMCCKKNMWHPE